MNKAGLPTGEEFAPSSCSQSVISASICTKRGKTLVSRQFAEMERSCIEGLLAAFPKLMAEQSPKERSYIETENIRYVYQPLVENETYLLLLATKASNILNDLETLRVLAKLVAEVAGGLTLQAITDHAFELIFAFDEELTSMGGYKEEATLPTIRANLIMDSQEARIHMALKQSKEAQTCCEMRNQAKVIKERQMAQLRQAFIADDCCNQPPEREKKLSKNRLKKLAKRKVIRSKILAKSGTKLGSSGGQPMEQSLQEAQQAESTLADLSAIFGKMTDLISQQGEVLEKVEDDVGAGLGEVAEDIVPQEEGSSRSTKDNKWMVPSEKPDYTTIPKQLDQVFGSLDAEGALSTVTLTTGEEWTRKRQETLLDTLKLSIRLQIEDQRTETNKALDLVDALSRSGYVDSF